MVDQALDKRDEIVKIRIFNIFYADRQTYDDELDYIPQWMRFRLPYTD